MIHQDSNPDDKVSSTYCYKKIKKLNVSFEKLGEARSKFMAWVNDENDENNELMKIKHTKSRHLMIVLLVKRLKIKFKLQVKHQKDMENRKKK